MIVLTAPTGLIGHQVLKNVLDKGEPIRVIVRDASKLPAEVLKRVDVVQGSHADPAVAKRAFRDADAVFWLVPPDPKATSVEAAYVDFSRPACDAFRSEGVKYVVGVSSLGRGKAQAKRAGNITASLAMDDLIASAGVNYRALANSSFMDNILRQTATIKSNGFFSSPTPGDLKVATCATRDIAAIAAKMLIDRSWSGNGDFPVLWSRRFVFQRNGANHVGCSRQAGALRGNVGRGSKDRPSRTRTIRGHDAGYGRHDGGYKRRHLQWRGEDFGIQLPYQLSPVVRGSP